MTEHGQRLLCAACIRRALAGDRKQPGGWISTLRALRLVWGLFLAWLFFYGLGQILRTLPAHSHSTATVPTLGENHR